MGGAQVVSIIDADMVIRLDFYQRMLPYLQTERDALVLAPQVRSLPVWELGASKAPRSCRHHVQLYVVLPGHAIPPMSGVSSAAFWHDAPCFATLLPCKLVSISL